METTFTARLQPFKLRLSNRYTTSNGCRDLVERVTVDVCPPIAYHGGPRGSIVRASAYAKLDGERNARDKRLILVRTLDR